MLTFESVILSFLIGFVPIGIWLIFWLLQDRKREPKKLIFRAFIAGIISVIIVLPFQYIAVHHLPSTTLTPSLLLIITLAGIEEVIKFFTAWVLVLRHRHIDEPIDVPVLLITTALGFAALENTLFVANSLTESSLIESVLTGNLRFIGATLIHVLSSAVIGGALAFAFYEGKIKKTIFLIIGVILAIALHSLFNFLIINTDADYLLIVFSGVWVGVVFLLIALERIKMIKRPAWWEKIFIHKK